MRIVHILTADDEATYTVEMSKAEYNMLKMIQREADMLPPDKWKQLDGLNKHPYTPLLGALVWMSHVYAVVGGDNKHA